jgi:hypothetical protein
MILKNTIISLREAVLDSISNARKSAALNLPDDLSSTSIECEPTAELRVRLQEILRAAHHEEDGSVDYAALRLSASYADYRMCAAQLKGSNPDSLSRNERLAFWINLYNTLVLDGVITLGIRTSVTEQWAGIKFFRQAAYKVGGLRVSCDDIEHGILRGNRGHPFLPGAQFRQADPRLKWAVNPPDPRIHFALNCASRSCPPIRVYAAETLETQLDLATRHFIDSETSILPEASAFILSRIFKWFQADFGGREGVMEFLLAHLARDERREWLEQNHRTARLRYSRYDWRLND